MSSRANADAAGRRWAALPWPVACWVTVLLLTGIVQILRAQWFDTAVFFAAALFVVVSRWIPARAARRVPQWAILAGAAAAGLVVCLLPRHSVGMIAMIIAVGAGALALTWPGGSAASSRWTRGLRLLGGAWCGLVVAGCLWELAQFVLGQLHPADPSYAFSNLLDPLLDVAPGKVLFIAAWLACGVLLLRRGGGR
ncbi:hypothetical protein GCM10023171_04350 [Microbacterium panaciterrae]|uniref:Uncharacterized protein n=2 Tax=Microbacterium panaciterrae TaxID=985759 RepID=A0ABP8P1E4_9MICO